ncbi:hypothetical protein QFC19_004093 [Naganishia cerealis]|uniref:Uncharacterized protein n=1 Tax=Naganishia cerealis TaxID=610337 RepID=A0ACC2VXA8_9TREE|nr:hypothetical protein QFC19_004093 [Naganishia cerealis]
MPFRWSHNRGEEIDSQPTLSDVSLGVSEMGLAYKFLLEIVQELAESYQVKRQVEESTHIQQPADKGKTKEENVMPPYIQAICESAQKMGDLFRNLEQPKDISSRDKRGKPAYGIEWGLHKPLKYLSELAERFDQDKPNKEQWKKLILPIKEFRLWYKCYQYCSSELEQQRLEQLTSGFASMSVELEVATTDFAPTEVAPTEVAPTEASTPFHEDSVRFHEVCEKDTLAMMVQDGLSLNEPHTSATVSAQPTFSKMFSERRKKIETRALYSTKRSKAAATTGSKIPEELSTDRLEERKALGLRPREKGDRVPEHDSSFLIEASSEEESDDDFDDPEINYAQTSFYRSSV